MGISRINLKLNEKAALVIGLGVPSLVLIYYLFKRNPNELDEDDLINGNRTLKVRSTCLEVRIPSECVKRVIGPQGAVIKEIQRKTNTRINFKEKPEATAAGGGKSTESVLLIRGSAVNTQRAEIEIKRLVLDTPVTLTREYLIPEYACGRIIGRGGASVREISQLSSCKVLIDKRFDSSALIRDKSLMNIAGIPMNSAEFANTSHKVVTLCGSIEQIESAKDLILAKIKEENEIREKKRGKLQPFQYQQSSMDKASRRKCKSMERIALINDRSSSSAIPEPTQQHIQLPTTSTSSSRTPAVKPLDFEALLNENKRVDVFVTAFSSTLVFWIQIAANVDLVRKLADDMSSFYSSQASSFLDFFNKDELKDHDLVAVRRRDNGYTKWFRAEIKSTKVRLEGVDRPELIDVYYIDDGISDYVQLRDIRLLGSQFCELPMQAIECTTCEVRSKYANWSEEAIGFFENFIFEVEYPGGREIEYLGARDSEGRAIVRLFDKASQSSVSDLLIEKGFAERLLLAKSPSVPLDKISEANEPEQNQDEQNNDQNQVVQEQIQEQDGLNNNDDSNI